jgi:protein-disulfide isomerase
MKNYILPASILIAAVLISGSLIYNAGVKKTATVSDNLNLNLKPEVLLNIASNDVVLGEADAPVTVIVYSDISCPFCAAAAGKNQEVMDYLKSGDASWKPPIPGIIENYVNIGKAKLVYRYFPGHGTGEEVTKILFCANEQGKFWELHDEFFANQGLIEDAEKAKELAIGIGVDIVKINSCLKEGKYDAKIAKDIESGKTLEVKGTPAFFVNGTKLEGAYSFSQFKLIIDAILSR